MKNEYAFADKISGEDLKISRNYLHLTQRQLSELIGVNIKTVERWEKPQTVIDGPVVRLIRILVEKPNLIEQFRIPEQELPLRMLYYYRDELCTIADVDENQGLVEVINFTDRLQYRAFGSQRDVSINGFYEFLESRCMPKSRDKLELELRELGLPFYDPLLIIEKTKGKMAEDDFWIDLRWKMKEV
ncbi:MAG: transcriptional regulator [Firmicutes bacterium]|nr:transcriptional regulator [Bacillota bacterium]